MYSLPSSGSISFSPAIGSGKRRDLPYGSSKVPFVDILWPSDPIMSNVERHEMELLANNAGNTNEVFEKQKSMGKRSKEESSLFRVQQQTNFTAVILFRASTRNEISGRMSVLLDFLLCLLGQKES